jgi:hypothetical protein
VAEEEPVTSPDQHKPGNAKLARTAAVGVIVILLLMICGSHRTIDTVFLVVTAALIAVILVGDWLLRKNGLR